MLGAQSEQGHSCLSYNLVGGADIRDHACGALPVGEVRCLASSQALYIVTQKGSEGVFKKCSLPGN